MTGTYDPVPFSDFVGNRNLIELLRRNALPPSSVFVGPEGVGKATLAVSLAALANCKMRQDGDLCGNCPSCIKVGAGNHPDVIFLDFHWMEAFLKSRKKRPNPRVIPIDVVRELVREAQFRPYQGALRIFIVDEAHKLNEAAANAMLKTLEEPSSTTSIILVTPFPQSLLPTILSRCQIFSFSRLRRSEVTRCVKAQARAEDPELRAALSDGSIGAALSLDLEQLRSDRDQLMDLLQKWVGNPVFSSVFAAVESSGLGVDLRNRERALELLLLLQRLVEDLYYLVVGTPQRVRNIDHTAKLKSIAAGLELSWIESFLYSIRKAAADVEAYVNPLMCFETLWLDTEKK